MDGNDEKLLPHGTDLQSAPLMSGASNGPSSLSTTLFGEATTPNDLFSSSSKSFDEAVKERSAKIAKQSAFQRGHKKAAANDFAAAAGPPTDANDQRDIKLSTDRILAKRRAQASSLLLEVITSSAPYPANSQKQQDTAVLDNPEENEISIPPEVRLEETAQVVRMYGLALVSNCLSRSLVQQLSNRATEIEQELHTKLDQHHHVPWQSGDSFRFYEVASRCKGRMEVRYKTNEMPFSSPLIVENNSLLPIIHNLLGGGQSDDPYHNPVLVYAGLILSSPGSDNQPWHQDGMPLFVEANGLVLPPYAINVLVPLSDHDGRLEAGPTEFVPSSHIQDAHVVMQKVNQTTTNDSDDQVVISPILKQGDALVYDYRVCHRGTCNLSDKTRRILYLMYARPWFKEHLNFGEDHLFEKEES